MNWLTAHLLRLMSREAERRRASAPRQPPPDSFVREISAADRVVVLDEGSAITTFTGEQAATLIKGFCSGQRDDRPKKEMFPFILEFYRGARLLNTARFSGSRFIVGEAKYAVERGGVVADLLAIRWSDPESYRTWTDTLAERVLQKPGCAQLQSWCVGILQRHRRGELNTQPGIMRYPEVPPADLPDWLRAALPGWMAYVVTDASGRAECVLLASFGWNGALLIGSPDFVTNQESFRLRWPKIDRPVWYIAKSLPGIYAYHLGNYGLTSSS
jgi:hypothetical protein